MCFYELFDDFVKDNLILLTRKKNFIYGFRVVVRVYCHNIFVNWVSRPLNIVAKLSHHILLLGKSALFEESLDDVELVSLWVLHQEHLARCTSIQVFVID